MKSLLLIWTSSLLTFSALAAYMLPHQESINAPGELGENFAAMGLVILCSLVLVSAGVLIFSKKSGKVKTQMHTSN